MATHSSILAWRIPKTEEPGGLLSMGSNRVGLAAAAIQKAGGRLRICSAFLSSQVRFSLSQFSCSVMPDSATPWTVAHQASLSITNFQSLLAQTHVHQVGDTIQPSHPLLSPSPLSFNLSQHPMVFSSELILCIRWPKYLSFSISPSNEYSGLISFRIDWFDLLAVRGTLKNLFQQHRLKALILWHSAFFMVQLSHPDMTTGKTIALTRRTFVGNVSAF